MSCNVTVSCRRSSPALNMTMILSPSGSAFSNTSHSGSFADDMNLHYTRHHHMRHTVSTRLYTYEATRVRTSSGITLRASMRGSMGSTNVSGSISLTSFSFSRYTAFCLALPSFLLDFTTSQI